MKKLIVVLLLNCVLVSGANAMNEIRTYMPFTYPVDPARIQIIPDMDMTFALTTSLVRWDDNKQTSAGISDDWKIVGPKKYRFYIRKGATWSNGEPITSDQVKRCFERAAKTWPEDFRSFRNLVSSMEATAPNELDFNLTVDAHQSSILKKLAEGNFGVTYVDSRGNLDLSISSGPFYLSKNSNDQELTLLRNSHWVFSDPAKKSADKIVVRRSPADSDPQTILLKDQWPNLIEASSLIDEKTLQEYQVKKFEMWKHPLDKFFYIHMGKRLLNDDGRKLLLYLGETIKKQDLVKGLSGYSIADQVYPKGCQLFDAHFDGSKKEKAKLPAIFKSRPLEILISPSRVSPILRENIKNVLTAATGVEPHFISVPLQEVTPLKIKGDFDLYAGTVGLADPDPEGAMSFYFEGDAPIIWSKGNDFLQRLDLARKESDSARLPKMRAILSDAVYRGYVLPLFHISTLGLGKAGLDFSEVPPSDESVTLSKVLFKGQESGR